MSKTHWKKLTNPDYLGAYDFAENEKSRVLQIKQVIQQKVKGSDGKEEECVIAHFTQGKPMIMNKTNMKATTIALKSPFIEDWSGKHISLHVEKVKAFGDIVDALRIDTAAPKMDQPSQPKQPASDLIILKKDDQYWAKVIAYVKGNANSKDFDSIEAELSRKYKMSPTISKSLKSEYDESRKS
jgi:hypothetical protein